MNAVNPCDERDEREAAGLAAPVPNIDVEKLRGLSKMIAERAVTSLENHVKARALAFFKHFFWGKGSGESQITLSTLYQRATVKPDPNHPGHHLVTLGWSELDGLLQDNAIKLNKNAHVAAALKEFLERADSLADDVQQLRDQVQS